MNDFAIDTPTIKPKSDLWLGLSGSLTALMGYSVIFLLPSFVESSANHFVLNGQQLGWLGSADTGGLALSTLLMAFLIHRCQLSRVLLAGVAISLLGNGLSLMAGDLSPLLLSRLVAGFGEGLLVSVGMSALAQTRDTNRWFAIYTAAVVTLQAAGLFFLPSVVELWGYDGVLYCFSALIISPLFLLWALPRYSSVQHGSIDKNSNSFVDEPSARKPLLLSMLAVLGFYISIGTVWTYVANIGTGAGFDFAWVSKALSLSMIGGFLGALLLLVLGRHAKGRRIYLASALLMFASLLALLGDLSQSRYLAALIAYSVVWSIIASKLFSDIADADHSGRFITACQPMLNIGFALGPLITSVFVLWGGNEVIIILASIALCLCIVSIMPLAQRLNDKSE